MPKALKKVIPHPTDPTLALVDICGGHYAVISAIDSEAVGAFNWHKARGYAQTNIRRSDGTYTTLSLHRFIGSRMDFPRQLEVDHRNGNGIDCRRLNLRPATRNQNAQNVRQQKRPTSTGIKGVWWWAAHKTYRIQIQANGVKKKARLFPVLEDAIEALRVERERLHGEFANHGGSN